MSTRASRYLFTRLLLSPCFIPACIGAGLLIRILVAVCFPIEPMSDAAWYVGRAGEIAAGLGYQESGYPTAYWPVGWPAILAGGLLVFKSVPLTVLVLNSIAAVAIMSLVVVFARLATGNELIARLALFAYALYPNHIAYHGAANSETVYLAIFMAAFAALILGRNRILLLIVCGVLFGFATLVKPQTLAFPFGAVIALALVYREFSWLAALRAGLIVYLVLMLVLLPWSFRNKEIFGQFVLVSTNGGFALLLGANDQVTGDHFDYQYTPVYKQFGIPWKEHVKRQIELNRLQRDAARQWIADHPYSWIAWMPRKVFKLWLKDTDGFWSIDRSYPGSTWIVRVLQVANQLFYVIVLGCSLYTGFIAGRALITGDRNLTPLGLLWCTPVFVSLLAAIFTGQIRYHHAAMPFLIISAAWAVDKLLCSGRNTVFERSDVEATG